MADRSGLRGSIDRRVSGGLPAGEIQTIDPLDLSLAATAAAPREARDAR